MRQSLDHCRYCDKEIKVMAFKKSGVCSDICNKRLGLDVSSVGTQMFVSQDEEKLIKKMRRHDG